MSLSDGGPEMTNLRPRKVAHRGRVEAAGFLFNTELIGVAETRRRILDLWESGVQVFADGPNYFVRSSSTVRVDCARSVATPLVRIESLLSALPLSKDEIETLQATSHSVVFLKGGVAQLAQLSSSIAEAPEKWLDVAAFKVVEVASLGAAFGEPKVVGEPQPFDARAKLDGIPAEASERREAIAAIQAAVSGNREQSDDDGVAQKVRFWLGGLIGSISSAIGGLVRPRNSASGTFTTRPRTSSDQGLLSKANDWLSRLGMRLLHTSRLARILG